MTASWFARRLLATRHPTLRGRAYRLVTGCRVVKDESGADEHVVTGIVMAPDEQISADEIRDACEFWMESVWSARAPSADDRARLLENWIVPCEFRVRDVLVPEGAWLQSWRVLDRDLWQRIKAGELEGLAAAGLGLGNP